jgi:hypothetical protein
MISIKSFKKESGQILVETMVALTMVTIGLLGLLNLLSSSIGLNKVVSDQYVASYLAAEGIEIVKNIIDNNIAENQAFNAGLAVGTYEVDYNSDQLISASPNSLKYLKFDGGNGGSFKYTYNPLGTDYQTTNFTRMITTHQGALGSDELVVQSKVGWVTRGGGELDVVLEDHFYNWRQ